MILAIRTDKPEAELYLLANDGRVVAEQRWHGHRQLSETIHKKINELLHKHGTELKYLTGIIVFKGPGSFTGLRIGISVANALAASLEIPVVSAGGEDWQKMAVQKLARGNNEEIVVPDYGSPPHITKPKK